MLDRMLKAVKYLLLIIGALFVFVPFLWMLSTSLKTGAESISIPPTLLPANAQWGNYVQAWGVAPWLLYFRNTLIIAVVGTTLLVLISILSAYAFTIFSFPGKKIIFMLYLATMMIPSELLIIQNYVTVTKLGWIDSFRGIIIPTLANGFYIFMLREYFMQVPSSLFRAAKVDGCGTWGYLWKVMVPMSKNAVSTIAILSFISYWNSFVWPLMVTNTDAHRVLSIGLMQFNYSVSSEVHLQMAGTTIVLLPMVIFYIIFRKKIVSGVAKGGIKG
ncbi:MAG: carbohydrate ABC transporter permease [Eubacteriales bacterium]|nr:carbohydrate ABC transporter permease [Eubacteriales bacterium]